MAALSAPASIASTQCSYDHDSRIQFTFDTVNWDILSSLECKLLQVDSSHWGDQISGGYNLVRFLHLHDSQNTTLVARVPLRSEDDISTEHDSAISKRIESEVATMEYVKSHTNIPVPHVYHHSAHAKGEVGSPYILMSKVEGVRLVSVVDILLELWSQRFDKPGPLFKRTGGGEGKDAWCIEPVLISLHDTELRHGIVPTLYSDAASYWLAYANATIHDLCNSEFGLQAKKYRYCQAWFIRSRIPSLFDPSLDIHGFPLTPGDFHSQNIMITDVDTYPRITAIIDWEFSSADFVTTFAQYPFFIVDHPFWDNDHPLRERNKRDQATFNELILEAERIRTPVSGPQLSRLISNSYGIYLFQQAMVADQVMSDTAYTLFFAHVFGHFKNFIGGYCSALMDNGILKKDEERFDMETNAWLEAREVLGDDEVGKDLKLGEFKDLVSKHLDKFNVEGGVCKWLASPH
ncbi:hypothetical protein M413DRAFT_25879 [Hebeloma cylindrosporum]|uniref:Aminoglycoside phosphotransferase domain-containing protein n=1 Tax=Hebeloma cylindrosporum TaxID=76867 RepID=A0A0C3C3Q9_HEBCY|nr:hypothetical protein M413DRAFT_25879 [Hebeloma cylindrosporum h7]